MSAQLDTITPIQIELLPEHKKLRDEILAERIERLPQLMRPTPSARLNKRGGGMMDAQLILDTLKRCSDEQLKVIADKTPTNQIETNITDAATYLLNQRAYQRDMWRDMCSELLIDDETSAALRFINAVTTT